jgi:tRNA(Ile)-lysidine synthase TilS/MesJ
MDLYDRNIRRVAKSAGKMIFDHGLIAQGDRVLVGLSGGKDSLTLLDVLASWNARSPVKAEIVAAHVESSAFGSVSDIDVLTGFCASRGVQLIHRKIDVDLERDPHTDKCFVCAMYRRKELFDIAREFGYNKLALGHHLDDLIATLFMNMCYRGNISTMPLKVNLFKGKLSIIRPLGAVEESAIVTYSRMKKLPVQKHECPYGKDQARRRVNGIIDQLAAGNPCVRSNILRSMSHIRADYLVAGNVMDDASYDDLSAEDDDARISL